MDTERIESFKQFAKYLEYPMVVFEAETGNVLDINYEAEVLLGGQVECIQIEPGRAFTQNDFWETLHGKKSLIWNRIRMTVDGKEVLVSGLINEMEEEGTLIYTLLFERRADLNIGSLTLERIVEHAGIVAVHISRVGDECQIEYVSRNINQYGYSRGQLYDKVITIKEFVCSEDYEKLRALMFESIMKKKKEDTIECRIVTEVQDLIPVRLLIHYIYDANGELTDMELLVLDLRDEYRRNRENAYLNNAITKMKNVVVVKSYRGEERNLDYVSPNANMVGMNVEALRKGYKLTEDYVHPDDRDSVMDGIYHAIANGITDYIQEYRMVRDDGEQIWVENEVTVNRISDGEAEISFLITDITERKNIEMEMAAALVKEDVIPERPLSDSLSLITIDEEDKDMLAEFQMMADALSKNANYYSVVLDAEGKHLTKPVGPMNDLGRFYDMFERPGFHEEFGKLASRAKEQRIPQSTFIDIDSLQAHMIFAPLILKDAVTAYWVLTSFAPDGAAILGEVVDIQWKLANSIAKSFYSQQLVQKETKAHKLAEVQLRKEQAEHRAIEEILSSGSKEGDVALSEMCHKVGVHLSIDYMAVYLENKESEKVEKYFVWSQSMEENDLFGQMVMSQSEYAALDELFKNQSLLIANNQAKEPFLKEIVRKTNMSVVLHKLSISSETEGYIIYANEDRKRIYDSLDQHFVATVTQIFENAISYRRKRNKPDVIRTGLLESYDHIRDAVYVKDNRTGEIVFANKAMDKLFGYSLVGMLSTEVINDTMEKYRNMGGIRKRFIAAKQVSKWQTYIKELDQIMNIVEVHMETLYGADWSLLIFKKSKNKDYKDKKRSKDS